MFRYLASTYPKAPWILASATLDDDCIHSIIQELGTKRWASHTCMFLFFLYNRNSYKVLYMDCDRANVYQQSRRISKSLKIGYVPMSSILLCTSQEHRP